MLIFLNSSKLISAAHNSIGSIALNKVVIGREVASIPDFMSPKEQVKGLLNLGPKRMSSLRFQEAIRWNPANAQAYRNLGQVYLMESNYPAAVEMLSKSAELCPGNVTTHFKLGAIYEATGNREAAIKEWQKTKVTAMFMQWVEQLQKQGRYAQALAWCELVVAIEPQSVGPYLKIEILYSLSGQWDKALDAYKKVLSMDSRNLEAHMTAAGVFLYGKNDPEEAMRLIQRTFSSPMVRADQRPDTSETFDIIQQFSEAVKQGRGLRSMYVSNEWANFQYYYLGRYLAGEKLLYYYRAHFLLGSAFDMLGDSEKALEHYLLVAKYRPENAAIHYYLARAYRNLSQLDKAKQEYERALEIYPGKQFEMELRSLEQSLQSTSD
jgi:tetratricopeptide (TPR) repeat protein